MAKLNPYLSFQNNCREAMNFYKSCFGGELFIQKVSEMPAMATQMPPELKDHILHSTLTAGGITIMASDLNRYQPNEGNTFNLCLNCESETELNDLFSKLSAGGEVVQALDDVPWGGKYGELKDPFGKHWILTFS